MVFDRAHALIVGVGSYSHTPQFDIPLTVGDAQKVADVLRDRQYCCYPEQQVTLLHDETATRARILNELDRLASLQENETFLLFYSGHGVYGEDGYYLTTHETQLKGGKVVAGSGVRDRELLDKIQQIGDYYGLSQYSEVLFSEKECDYDYVCEGFCGRVAR